MPFKIFRKNCCGLDVHKTWIYACIGITDPNGRTEYKQARFSAFSKGLHDLASWLSKYECTEVCMESSGKYWIPVFNVLEQFCWVTLAHPKYTKPQKGNKTDRKDAKWICDLFMCDMIRDRVNSPVFSIFQWNSHIQIYNCAYDYSTGNFCIQGNLRTFLRYCFSLSNTTYTNYSVKPMIIKPSFFPPPDIQQLRDLMRYRTKLTNMLTGEKNRALNYLTVSNLKLDDVFSDVFGKSSCSIIWFILEHPGEKFDVTPFIDRRYKHPVDEVAPESR